MSREITICPACDSKNILFFAKKENYVFSKCDQCGLICINPPPDLATLISDFYSESSGYHATLPEHLDAMPTHNKKFVNIIDKLTSAGVKGNLLDVGCSHGEFMFLAKKKGFVVFGVEPNARTAHIARNNGLEVFCGTLEEARFADNYFSVIYLGDIIEHVPDPLALLKECERILKPDGVLVIVTPNTNCFWVKATHIMCQWSKFPWSVLIPPYHIYLFSDTNIRPCVQKYHFTVNEIMYHRVYLRHELGGTGLAAQYRQKKSLGKLCYAFLVFLVYTIVYVANVVLRPLVKKDFGMIVFAKKYS